MANRTYAQIKADLNTELQAVVDDGTNPVQDLVYGYKTGQNSGYPYIRYMLINIGTDRLTRNDYYGEWTFRVEIVQEIAEQDEGQAEDDLGKSADAVMQRLEENWDLSGDMLGSPQGDVGQDTDASGKVRIVAMLATIRTFRSYAN